LIFPAPAGGHIKLDNWRRRVWKEAIEASGVEYRPLYQMRHTFATLALAAGADLYWVSRQLGHESIRTTLKHYARFVPRWTSETCDFWTNSPAERLKMCQKRVIPERLSEFSTGPTRPKGGNLQGLFFMELAGLEPATSWVRSRRSPN
jgi:hypothetical protein